VPDLQATLGNRGEFVLRWIEGDRAHFRMISLWESAADIEAFAGDPIERARYYAEDADYLPELAPAVTHFEVLHAPQSSADRLALKDRNSNQSRRIAATRTLVRCSESLRMPS